VRSQRVRDGGSLAESSTLNGPLRVQSKDCFFNLSILQRISCVKAEEYNCIPKWGRLPCKTRWHHGLLHSSL